MNKRLRVGVIGATGYVGQTFICLLAQHPYFELTKLYASARSAGKAYAQAIEGSWHLKNSMPESVGDMPVHDVATIADHKDELDFVFCAVNMPKAELQKLEEDIAKLEIPVVSNNSAHRGTPDVPMIIPEINPEHSGLIAAQRQRLGTKYGFIAVKPNCSLQSYVPAVTPLLKFGVESINVVTFQAISGAGKTFATWPEMVDNLIPFIGGEEEKTENEPYKIWSRFDEAEQKLKAETSPIISAQCYRVAVQNGHTAAVSIKFKHKPTREEILTAWREYRGLPQQWSLPMAPEHFVNYLEEENRPQPQIDAEADKGMAIWVGRLREDKIFDYKFCCLSHNTLRGAAGGAVLTAELLYRQGYLHAK